LLRDLKASYDMSEDDDEPDEEPSVTENPAETPQESPIATTATEEKNATEQQTDNAGAQCSPRLGAHRRAEQSAGEGTQDRSRL
jgi:hypothetical protein